MKSITQLRRRLHRRRRNIRKNAIKEKGSLQLDSQRAFREARRTTEKRRTPVWRNKEVIVACCLVLLVAVVAGGTFAFLNRTTNALTNTFKKAIIDIDITEKFDGTVKKDIVVTNTSDSNTDAYVRVKVICYWADEDGNPVGKAGWTPSFALGSGWVLKNGYYYYTIPLAPGEKTPSMISGSITLEKDEDENRQAMEVVADGVQARPENAAIEAWGVDPGTLS